MRREFEASKSSEEENKKTEQRKKLKRKIQSSLLNSIEKGKYWYNYFAAENTMKKTENFLE